MRCLTWARRRTLRRWALGLMLGPPRTPCGFANGRALDRRSKLRHFDCPTISAGPPTAWIQNAQGSLSASKGRKMGSTGGTGLRDLFKTSGRHFPRCACGPLSTLTTSSVVNDQRPNERPGPRLKFEGWSVLGWRVAGARCEVWSKPHFRRPGTTPTEVDVRRTDVRRTGGPEKVLGARRKAWPKAP
jgi:hypothetical protein